MTKSPLVETSNKAIAVVGDESSQEFDREVEYHEEIVGRIVKGSTEKLMVLDIVLRELPKLAKGKKIGFDFGTFKEFELKRIK